MVGHTRMNKRMDEKVGRDLMTGFMVDEAREEGEVVLIVRVSKDAY